MKSADKLAAAVYAAIDAKLAPLLDEVAALKARVVELERRSATAPHKYDVKMLRALMRDGVITKDDLRAVLEVLDD